MPEKSVSFSVSLFLSFLRMLVSRILARIMQHAKLGLQTETISVCVLMDLDLKAMIVMRVRNLILLLRQKHDE